MAAPDTSQLFSKLHELRTQQGKGWKEIANILEEEGYEENGKALTENALRKRYAKWSKTEEVIFGKPPLPPDPKRGGSDPFSSPEDAIASLVDLNRQLLEQIQESNRLMQRLEKRLEEQESKTGNTEHADEQPVTTRDLLELLKEFGARRQQEMRYIEENKEYYLSREEIQQLIEESVQDRVDAELKSMLTAEGSFAGDLAHLVDHRLKTLFSSSEPVATAPQAGPGRGKKGKSHVKFSASLESNLYARAKSLPGQFSRHLANALSTYLSVMEEKKED